MILFAALGLAAYATGIVWLECSISILSENNPSSMLAGLNLSIINLPFLFVLDDNDDDDEDGDDESVAGVTDSAYISINSTLGVSSVLSFQCA